MSLILEALRKSEAERRRAQVPDLLAEPQAAVAPLPVAPQRWPWLVLGAAMLLGALWLLRALVPAPAPRDAAVAGRDAGVAEDAVSREAKSEPDAPPLRRPLVVAPAVATASREAMGTATPRAASAPFPGPPPRAGEGVEGSASAAVPESRAAVAVKSPRADAPAVQSPPTAIAAVNALPAATPPQAAPQLQPHDAMLRVSDLGSGERSQLPPLKLSMHMWNDAPAQRFVIIDGNRLGIGARIGELTIADIVSDGVVLDWNGRLLKLPLR